MNTVWLLLLFGCHLFLHFVRLLWLGLLELCWIGLFRVKSYFYSNEKCMPPLPVQYVSWGFVIDGSLFWGMFHQCLLYGEYFHECWTFLNAFFCIYCVNHIIFLVLLSLHGEPHLVGFLLLIQFIFFTFLLCSRLLFLPGSILEVWVSRILSIFS